MSAQRKVRPNLALKSLLSPIRRIGSQLRLRTWLALLILAVVLIGLSGYERNVARSPLRLSDLQPLSLDTVQRLLVVSPHPDDETLGAGGLIQAAKSQQVDVRIAIVTNGDGQRFAPVAFGKHLRPKPENYISWGELRQEETLAAARHLGVSETEILFLGYPDRGLARLWIEDWQADCPLRSAYTRAERSPYLITFDSDADYCGSALLADFLRVLNDFHPDLIVLPHPDDDHPDHRAVYNFTMLALAVTQEAEPDYQPTVRGYLVHEGQYPQPRGLRTNQFLLPPSRSPVILRVGLVLT